MCNIHFKVNLHKSNFYILYSKNFLCLSGMTSTAAYRKWEKAAIAGVSLVADAAEHLERSATVKEIEQDQENPGSYCACSFVLSLLL